MCMFLIRPPLIYLLSLLVCYIILHCYCTESPERHRTFVDQSRLKEKYNKLLQIQIKMTKIISENEADEDKYLKWYCYFVVFRARTVTESFKVFVN